MTDCPYCDQNMNAAESCTKNAIIYPFVDDPAVDGIYRVAIPYGEETPTTDPDTGETVEWDAERCHDCGVQRGGYHHPGCDVEESPLSERQLLSEVIENPVGSSPMHARIEPDPHEDISIEDVIEAQRERGGPSGAP